MKVARIHHRRQSTVIELPGDLRLPGDTMDFAINDGVITLTPHRDEEVESPQTPREFNLLRDFPPHFAGTSFDLSEPCDWFDE